MCTGLLPRPLQVRVLPPQPLSHSMNYKVSDIVLVKSYAGPKVWVRLKERVLKPKDFWGASGWDANIIYKKDIDQLIKSGVPYERGKQPRVFVYDWQLIKRKKQ